VSDALQSEEDRLILKAVAGLGKSLGIETTAEGVETDEHKELVKLEGYSQMQGYLFSRPIPNAMLADYLDKETDERAASKVAAAT
ncbi:MAG: EAL domain-containing protein, partial [Planctomycetota bacterium]